MTSRGFPLSGDRPVSGSVSRGGPSASGDRVGVSGRALLGVSGPGLRGASGASPVGRAVGVPASDGVRGGAGGSGAAGARPGVPPGFRVGGPSIPPTVRVLSTRIEIPSALTLAVEVDPSALRVMEVKVPSALRLTAPKPPAASAPRPTSRSRSPPGIKPITPIARSQSASSSPVRRSRPVYASMRPFPSPTTGMKSMMRESPASKVRPNAASEAAPDCPKQSPNVEQLSAAATAGHVRRKNVVSQLTDSVKRSHLQILRSENLTTVVLPGWAAQVQPDAAGPEKSADLQPLRPQR